MLEWLRGLDQNSPPTTSPHWKQSCGNGLGLMSKLALFGRPWVVFDPMSKDHRYHFHLFQSTGSWGKCPYRFVVDDDHGDLVTMIQRALIQYYTNKEFGSVVEKQQTIRPKRKRNG